ncbi:hypothetical protein [Bosea sp. BIWAKO-01]|uniref:hypothetical protein n=1 Tax=Bosea sp. BIWAKO-01 TaxID=506668 RepID=UPI00114D3285|nr:hypothetical protein [Bosea sp. BIWAKO-01]
MRAPRSFEEWRQIRRPSLGDFLRVADRWQLSEDDQVRILRCGSVGQLRRWIAINQTNEALVMSSDTGERIAAVVGAAEAAGYLYTSEDEPLWLRGPITGQPYQGQTPLSLMKEGSVEDIMNVRRYLMGLTQGGPGPNDVDRDFTPYTDHNLKWE